MINLKIDNQSISVPEETTLLEAAKSVGIHIPSMCYLKGADNCPSCMICVVKDRRTGNLVTSCALKVTEGMDFISIDDEIRESRKDALDLLLSDHVGDCEAPCSLSCPADMNIPEMNRLIAAGKFEESLAIVKQHIALPAVLGYICPAPCEKACRRKQIDNAVSICLLKRFVGQETKLTKQSITSESNVAIIGSGPAGLACAYYLLTNGIGCTLFDKNEAAGGALRYSISEDQLPRKVLETEISHIQQLGAKFRFNFNITKQNFETDIKPNFKAIVLATGDIAAVGNLAELFQTNNTGIVASDGILATSQPGIFACGSALRPQKMAVRAAAQGRVAAMSAIAYINGEESLKLPKLFNSRFDKLQTEEYTEYLKEASAEDRQVPISYLSGFSKANAMAEAKRCLHCDCRKLDNCKLRNYSRQYNADRKKYSFSQRKSLTKHFQHNLVVYEPEKCIKCGICVNIASKNKELIGLTYVGRGFDVQINVPFGKNYSEALLNSAAECADNCPTGALALK